MRHLKFSTLCILLIGAFISEITAQFSSKGLDVFDALGRSTVLIVEKKNKDYTHLGLGTVLNSRWIISAAAILEGRNPAKQNLYALAGNKKKAADMLHIKLTKGEVSNLTDGRGSLDKGFVNVVLFKTDKDIDYRKEIAEMMFGMDHRLDDQFYRCEMVSYHIENKVITQTQIKVKLIRDCKTTAAKAFCVELHAKHKDDKPPTNPCALKENLGAPIYCDVALEAIFVGLDDGKGCKSLKMENKDDMRAVFIIGNTDLTSWAQKIMDPGPVKQGFTDVYDEMDDSRPKFTVSKPTIDANNSAFAGNGTGELTNGKVKGAGTTEIAEKGGTRRKDGRRKVTKRRGAGTKRRRKKKARKCSGGFRHDQLFSFVLLFILCRYIMI